jgi:hypothetical protein
MLSLSVPGSRMHMGGNGFCLEVASRPKSTSCQLDVMRTQTHGKELRIARLLTRKACRRFCAFAMTPIPASKDSRAGGAGGAVAVETLLARHILSHIY